MPPKRAAPSEGSEEKWKQMTYGITLAADALDSAAGELVGKKPRAFQKEREAILEEFRLRKQLLTPDTVHVAAPEAISEPEEEEATQEFEEEEEVAHAPAEYHYPMAMTEEEALDFGEDDEEDSLQHDVNNVVGEDEDEDEDAHADFDEDDVENLVSYL
ncbi:uncharacterized protein EV422DRAFT_569955 [Fimicolochytrium jonesii]|uniref:uncharacterized protein n=1 Tax=Fimicolochytrium jonesii TaxID=1396493 RepID=UPI0022FECBB2|nr:uncharacterized protein EV422DRAFT_569955 [Fimicolochytrium jonesii]KAI8818172.1 hypothetical protein EV422DRAFT_569955 [Fimicolochytrium jonesii]